MVAGRYRQRVEGEQSWSGAFKPGRYHLTLTPYCILRGLAKCSPGIDVDDAPHLASVGQSHCDVDAAPSADDLIGSFKTEGISLKVKRIRDCQCHMRLGIGESPRIVLTTKRALACTKHLVAWLPIGDHLYADSTAMALTLEEHVSSPFSKVPRQRHCNGCACWSALG
jgi:hypothetical protein